jgi:hypothetical protein
VSASYANFITHYNDKYCKDWKETPPENILEEYFSLLEKECFDEVLKETKFAFGNYRPSWFHDLMMKSLLSTMDNYWKSKQPLTLVQLCRTILRKGDALSTLRLYYEKINNPALKGKLFYNTWQVNSN